MKAPVTIAKRIAIAFSLTCSVTFGLWGNPALAGDPFRTSNPHDIGDKTEAAFNAVFKEGNYKQAKQYLIEATRTESQEPLVYAMQAAIAYMEGDFAALKTYALKTQTTAQNLVAKDPLRGNLYIAAGYFLEGGYVYKKEGGMSALGKLQEAFKYLDLAEQNNPEDPELNLVKGYLDLFLSVYLPFSSPEKAIDRFEKYAAPSYLVNRGIAVAYRDLKQYDLALQYLDKALQATPENPEVLYLKGQILRKQGLNDNNIALMKQSVTYFEKANKKREQLPETLLIPLDHDYKTVQDEIKKRETN
jgi:tetratricopeptide (TPR) repeat protein